MTREEELKKEKQNAEIARAKGWTEIHGGLADGGAFLRGFPPGRHGKGLMQPVPDYSERMTEGLCWHKLSSVSAGGMVVEVMGATCIDGTGVIARWSRNSDDTWEVDAIDTEEGTWRPRMEIDGVPENIPDAPPLVWDDRD